MSAQRVTRVLCALAAALALLLAVLLQPAQATSPELAEQDVSFSHDGVALHGTVLAPAGTPDKPRPAVVLIAGAGPTQRDAYRREAEDLARAGIVTLIYDKRAGYSRTAHDFDELAADALAGARMLRNRPGVQADLVGVWGHSQGGWVAPLAAAQSSDVAFVVTIAASGYTPDRTQLWSNRTYLMQAGVRDSLVGPLGLNASRMLMAAGLYGDIEHDSAGTWARVRQPVLAVFGEHDRSMPSGESMAIIRDALERGGNQSYSLRVISGVDHSMHASADGFDLMPKDAAYGAGFPAVVTDWINGLPARVAGKHVDPMPVADLTSQPVEPLDWFEAPLAHLVALGVILLCFLAYLLNALVRRMRRRRLGPAPAGSLALLITALLGLVAAIGTVVQVFGIVFTGGAGVTSVLGRPPLWLVLQLGSVVAVAAAAVGGYRWTRHPRTVGGRMARSGTALLVAVGLALFLPWAVYWGLFTI